MGMKMGKLGNNLVALGLYYKTWKIIDKASQIIYNLNEDDYVQQK